MRLRRGGGHPGGHPTRFTMCFMWFSSPGRSFAPRLLTDLIAGLHHSSPILYWMRLSLLEFAVHCHLKTFVFKIRIKLSFSLLTNLTLEFHEILICAAAPSLKLKIYSVNELIVSPLEGPYNNKTLRPSTKTMFPCLLLLHKSFKKWINNSW